MKKDIKKKIDEIIRVNHAGEFGAQMIYGGQIKFTRDEKLSIHHRKEVVLLLMKYLKNQGAVFG